VSPFPVRPLFFGGLVVLIDQLSKWIVEQSLVRGESISVLGDFFRLTHVQNPGGAFGLFRDAGSVFLVLSVVAILFLFWALRRFPLATAGRGAVALGIVLGGAVGNLIDRVRTQRVIDFFDVGFSDLRWPVFNVADIAVVVGVGMFLLFSMRTGEASDERGTDGEGRDGPDLRSSGDGAGSP